MDFDSKYKSGKMALIQEMVSAYSAVDHALLREYALEDATRFVIRLSEGEIYRQLRVRGYKFDAKKDVWTK